MTLVNKILAGLAFAFLAFAGWSLYQKGKLAERNKVWERDYGIVVKAAAGAAKWAAKAETVLVVQQAKTSKALGAMPTVKPESIPVLVKDTAWAIDYVKKAEAAKLQCANLASACEVFRFDAKKRFAADSTALATLKAKPERSCKMTFVVGALTGAAAGGYVGYQVRRP